MPATLIKDIKILAGLHTSNKVLRGSALASLPVLENAWLLVENGTIVSFGSMDECPAVSAEVLDATGKCVLPAWCDSHTHLVFAASREEEFVDKIRGLSYAEIAAKGGGILNSARKLALASEEELFDSAWTRLQQLIQLGTGAIEIKSGYGLSTADELKMLRVIQRIKKQSPIPVKATFLGAHTYPAAFKQDHEGYIKQIMEEMLPEISAGKLADYIDVFCEEGFFSVDEMERICEAGMAVGLRPKLHINQLNAIGGVQKGIELCALSLDHLEQMTEEDIRQMGEAETIGTLLPGAAFFLGMNYPPARQMIDVGSAIALASDYNPGSCPSGNMNLMLSLACIQMKMLPEEAINAATINGAAAMELELELGSIAPGKRANIILTKPVPSLAYLPYAFGSNLVDRVMINGKCI